MEASTENLLLEIKKLKEGLVNADDNLQNLRSVVQKLTERVVDAEGRLAVLEALGQFPSWSRCSPAERLALVIRSTKKYLEEKEAVLEFNEKQREKEDKCDPNDPPVTWLNNGVSCKFVVDADSFTSLAMSDVAPMELTVRFAEEFRVLKLVDDFQCTKLVTLSRDFKDGIGEEALWTPYQDTDWPQGRTKKEKRGDDPRFGVLDPRTMQLWEPGESESESEPVEARSREGSVESKSPESKSEESVESKMPKKKHCQSRRSRSRSQKRRGHRRGQSRLSRLSR